jgi:hypothetical protein
VEKPVPIDKYLDKIAQMGVDTKQYNLISLVLFEAYADGFNHAFEVMRAKMTEGKK